MSARPPADDGPPPVVDPIVDGVDRRAFLELLAAAVASSALPGCLRKPREQILPFDRRPEALIPGRPRRYATASQLTGSVLGLLVESQDGRPTKIEGNPRHPNSRGATDAATQAAVLDLYDPGRPTTPRIAGTAVSPASLARRLERLGARHARRDGAGLALLLTHRSSPTLRGLLLRDLRRLLPRAELYLHDAAYPHNTQAGAELVGLRGVLPHHDIGRAQRILSCDCDFLGVEGDTVRQSRAFARRRRPGGGRRMNRLYVVEPAPTLTGAAADHRLAVPCSQVGRTLADLIGVLYGSGYRRVPAAARPLLRDLARRAADCPHRELLNHLARDLLTSRRRSLVLVGERQPKLVHALGHLINAMLDNTGRTLKLFPDPDRLPARSIEQLSQRIEAKAIDTLVILGGNPAYDAPVDLDFADKLRRVGTVVQLTQVRNETSERAHWVIPESHFLECWGDLRATDGTLTIQQPLIAPLHRSIAAIELLAHLAGVTGARDSYQLVRRRWAGDLPAGRYLEITWRHSLHDGVRRSPGWRPLPLAPRFDRLPERWPTPPAPPAVKRLELVFQLDASVFDGRFADNAWLQELPDPLSKLAWGNAALVGVTTAAAHGLRDGDRVAIGHGGRRLELPVRLLPGVAAHCVALPLGYGRRVGNQAARGVGANAGALRASGAPWFAPDATLAATGRRSALTLTQAHDSEDEPWTGRGRPLVVELDHADYRRHSRGWKRDNLARKETERGAAKERTALFTPSTRTDGQQWGMRIDLSACIGCGACVVACQAENNVPVVGPEQVRQRREMHWLRVDRYFTGEGDAARARFLPLACQHCETAPCEAVCPVNATAHSPEGLNEMVYNQCVGTRFCAANCPYKVRRFNFFDFSGENDRQRPLGAMQRNPDVTVRSRGVMEKCSYCVQRIVEARIAVKERGRDKIPDGAVVPACQQACPTGAIVFGDIADGESAVRRLDAEGRDYVLLPHLNTRPRTAYLARLRNPNRRLAGRPDER